MGGYLVNFSVFTFAMIGIMFLAVFVYSKTNVNARNSKKAGGMKIEESLNLTPRKSLHVVNVNGEKFLIAADTERTEFLAKLDSTTTILDGTQIGKKINQPVQNFSEKVTPIASVLEQKKAVANGNVSLKNSTVNFQSSVLSKVKNINMCKPPVFKSILKKLEVQRG